MKAEIKYGLEGSFKLDLYSGEELVNSTDWFSNFITATGLVYPNIYAFAQCFRFLTIGSSSVPNDAGASNPNHNPPDYWTMDGTDTTGCYSPYYTYTTTAGPQTGAWMGWEFYSVSPTSSPCITTAGNQGPRFFRSWSVPNGPNSITMNQPGGGLNIAELSVSPSSGGDPTGCFAFSRIVRSLVIPNGFKGIISYQLQMNLLNSTGYAIFPSGTFNTGAADISEDIDLISGWGNLSGYYRQVWHGLDCVDASGATFYWNLGDGMEPSTQNLSNCLFYLSPDNSQFDVNNIIGGAQSNVSAAYNSDGLMKYLSSATTSTSNSALNLYPGTVAGTDAIFYGAPYGTPSPFGAPPNINYININGNYISNTLFSSIRLGNNVNGLPDPMIDNYSLSNDQNVSVFHPLNTVSYQTNQTVTGYTISYATPGALGFNPNRTPFPVLGQGLFSSNLLQLPFTTGNENGPCGRSKTITRVATFPPPISMGYNTRFGSLVYAFQDLGSPTAGAVNYWPMVDILFFDTSGRSMMPHYRLIDNIWLTQRGSGVANAYATLSGQIGNNITRIVSRQTFQGPYVGGLGYDTSAPALNVQTPNINTVGYLSSGLYPSSTTSGYSEANSVLSTTTGGFGSGWGMVYGLITDDVYWSGQWDLGLADHSLSVTGAPSQTGQIFWPSCIPSNQIVLTFTGVNFFHPSIGLIQDTGNWFINGQQMIQSIGFQDVDASRLTTVLGSTFSGNPALFNQSPTIPLNATSSGYYLTTQRYNYYSLNGATDNNSFMTLASGFFPNAITVTGFLDSSNPSNHGIPYSNNTGGMICVALPIYTGIDTTNLSGSIINAVRVTGFFQSPSDRTYGNFGWNGSRGFIGTGYNYPFFVSGYYNSVPPVPLFLTYVFSSGHSLVGHSYFNTIVTPTAFCQPSGTANHWENLNGTGWRLLPNYGTPNNLGTSGLNIYPPTVGGQYPATSLDNGLQLYFYINWSAPCGQAVNCNNPI